MDKIVIYVVFFLLCAAYLAASFVKERNKILKEVEKNRCSASLDELEQYKKKLLMFRKSLLMVIIELVRRKPFEKGNEAVENMLWRVNCEIRDRQDEQEALRKQQEKEEFQTKDTVYGPVTHKPFIYEEHGYRIYNDAIWDGRAEAVRGMTDTEHLIVHFCYNFPRYKSESPICQIGWVQVIAGCVTRNDLIDLEYIKGAAKAIYDFLEKEEQGNDWEDMKSRLSEYIKLSEQEDKA